MCFIPGCQTATIAKKCRGQRLCAKHYHQQRNYESGQIKTNKAREEHKKTPGFKELVLVFEKDEARKNARIKCPICMIRTVSNFGVFCRSCKKEARDAQNRAKQMTINNRSRRRAGRQSSPVQTPVQSSSPDSSADNNSDNYNQPTVGIPQEPSTCGAVA